MEPCAGLTSLELGVVPNICLCVHKHACRHKPLSSNCVQRHSLQASSCKDTKLLALVVERGA